MSPSWGSSLLLLDQYLYLYLYASCIMYDVDLHVCNFIGEQGRRDPRPRRVAIWSLVPIFVVLSIGIA